MPAEDLRDSVACTRSLALLQGEARRLSQASRKSYGQDRDEGSGLCDWRPRQWHSESYKLMREKERDKMSQASTS